LRKFQIAGFNFSAHKSDKKLFSCLCRANDALIRGEIKKSFNLLSKQNLINLPFQDFKTKAENFPLRPWQKVALAIPSMKREKELLDVIFDIVKNTEGIDYQIVIVGNYPEAFVEKIHSLNIPNLTYHNEKDPKFSKHKMSPVNAYNLGFIYNDCDYVMLHADDLFATRKDWLYTILTEMIKNKAKHGIFCSTEAIEYTGRFGFNFLMDYPSSNFFLMEKKLFKKLGFYPHNYFQYRVDSDITTRVIREGNEKVLLSTVKVDHRPADANRRPMNYHDELEFLRRQYKISGSLDQKVSPFITDGKKAFVMDTDLNIYPAL